MNIIEDPLKSDDNAGPSLHLPGWVWALVLLALFALAVAFTLYLVR